MLEAVQVTMECIVTEHCMHLIYEYISCITYWFVTHCNSVAFWLYIYITCITDWFG